MKTVYIAKANIPSNSANSVHVMKISEAFSEICEEFKLVVPKPQDGKNDIDRSFEYYGVKPFDVATVKIGKGSLGSRYGFPIKCLWKVRKADNIITRDPLAAFLAVLFRKNVVLDLHGDLRHLCGRAYRIIKWKFFRDSKYLNLVMITEGLAEYYQDVYKISKEKVTVLPDGYTDKNFENLEERKLFQNDSLKIGYCGGFLKGKGLGLIQQLTLQDPVNRYFLYGGTKENAEKEVNSAFGTNTVFGGYVENVKIPYILNEQDILLLPNQKQQVCKNEDIGKVTSPLKMFEYMASGKVIIASDLSVLREILDESNCYFAMSDDASDWKKVIDYVSAHREEAIEKARKAKEDVKQYTWKIRAEKMLALMRG